MNLLKWNKGGLKTPMVRARGLGSAKSGVEHWMNQRLTSVANIPLTLWFIYSLLNGVTANHAVFTTWLAQPVNAILMVLLVVSIFYHALLGVQVVIEDYVHNEGFKIFKLVGAKFFYFAAAIACIFSILKISFGA